MLIKPDLKDEEIIAEQIKAPVIEIAELQEACWGEKEGKLKGSGLWINGWRNEEDIKGAEGYYDFSTRIKRGLAKALEHNGPVLIVSHGCVYSVVQEILGLPIIDLGNAEPVFHRPTEHPTHPWGVYSLSEERNLYDDE